MKGELYVEKALEAKARSRRAREERDVEFADLKGRLENVEIAVAKLITLLGLIEEK